MSTRLRGLSLGLLLVGGATALSCADEPHSGGLVLLVARDGPLSLDRLDLRIFSKDQVLHDAQYRVPEEASLPTTFGITSNGSPTATVKITVTGWDHDAPLDRRDAIVTQVPTDRLALLKVVLSGRCSGQVHVEDGQAISACGENDTCDPATGDCASAIIDASKLPTYDENGSSAGGAGGDAGAGPMAVSSGGAGGDAAAAPMSAVGGASGGASPSDAAGAGAGGVGPRCNDGFRSCDDDPDRCETFTDEDVKNCGACGHVCPQTTGHAFCRGGQCDETVCEAPLADCNHDPDDGCEIDTSNADKHCGGCSLSCSEPTAVCTPSGCAGSRTIVVVNSDTARTFHWDDVPLGDAYRHTLTIRHELETPHREGDQGRVVIVGALAYGVQLADDTVTYAGITMQRGVSVQHGAAQAQVYYLLDEDLPPDAGTQPVVATAIGIPSADVALQVVELKNVNQIAPFAQGVTDNNAVCFDNVNLPINFNRLGAFTYAIAGAKGASMDADELSGLSEVWPDPDDFVAQVSAVTYFSNSGTNLHWAVEACGNNDSNVGAALAFEHVGIQGGAAE